MHTMAKKKTVEENFVMLPRSFFESFAWRACSNACRLAVERVMIEHLAHGGRENGELTVTKTDFMKHGIHNDGVAPALREAVALGLLELTRRGRAGNAMYRQGHRWAVTPVLESKGLKPYGAQWRRFKSMEEAAEAAAKARAEKDTMTVEMARRRVARGKIVPFPATDI